jgi:hypothetical protein
MSCKQFKLDFCAKFSVGQGQPEHQDQRAADRGDERGRDLSATPNLRVESQAQDDESQVGEESENVQQQ